MSLQNGQKVIAFDFDGVIHEYHGYNDGKMGEPMPGMKELINDLQIAGAHVVIHTTRNEREVQPWLMEHNFPMLDVYNNKWSRIDVFVDDRCIQFNPFKVADAKVRKAFGEALLEFQPYWRKAKA